jgi:hypothetical protein
VQSLRSSHSLGWVRNYIGKGAVEVGDEDELARRDRCQRRFSPRARELFDLKHTS